ncbi:MAG: class I SAM-dependent methyltransferase family protein [Candidatus Dormibacteria bacterium]
MPSEWVEWHQGYQGEQPLTKRLIVVQDLIREALDHCPSGPIRAISICAGDGRDLLGVVQTHPRGPDVRARLVDLDPDLVESGRVRAAQIKVGEIDFQLADASLTDVYAGAVPANLILVCGVFGNITDDDVRRTIDHLHELCAPRATVIWTRGRFEPDLTPTIRGWFSEAGFEEATFVPILGTTASVGSHRIVRTPAPIRARVRLFTFLNKDERPGAISATTDPSGGARSKSVSGAT